MCLDDCDGKINRRQAIIGAAAFAGATQIAGAAVVPPQDVSYASGAQKVSARLYRPAGTGALPAVLVAQGNPGFLDYLDAFCGRIASSGYAVLLVDVFGLFPPMPKDEAERPAWRTKTAAASAWYEAGMGAEAGLQWMRANNIANKNKVAALGFCGGGILFAHHAARGAKLDSLILFYANAKLSNSFVSKTDPLPDLMDIADRFKMPIQGHNGEEDPTAKAGDTRMFEQRLKAAGTTTEFHYYANAGHGFMKAGEPLEADHSWGFVPAAAAQAEARVMRELEMRLRS